MSREIGVNGELTDGRRTASQTTVKRNASAIYCWQSYNNGTYEVFRAVHGTEPEYLSELCRSNAEDTAHSRLRSATHGDLQVPRSKTTVVMVRLQSPDQRHGTDYQQHSGRLTKYQE